jgi:hypothetical protein
VRVEEVTRAVAGLAGGLHTLGNSTALYIFIYLCVYINIYI